MARPNIESLCIVPWISVEAAPDGTCRPCCVSTHVIQDRTGTDLSLATDTLSTAYHSKDMQQLRAQFLRGEKPASCNRCWQEEDSGRNSKRINTALRLQHLVDDIDWTDNPDQLWFLDLKLGNICNLKCMICGSWSSSSWAREEIDYDPNKSRNGSRVIEQMRRGQWPRKNTQFWEDITALLPQIRYIEFTGGEPFLIEQHFDFLAEAVASGHSNHIAIHYNTNGTVLPERHELWHHFEHVEIAFSIDDVGDRFEYQRHGAEWVAVSDNIAAINAQRRPGLTTQVCLTVNAQNIYYLPETVAWIDQQAFDYVFFNMLHDPHYMNIGRLTEASKQLVVTRLQAHDFGRHTQEIANIVKFMQQGSSSSGVDFCQRLHRADSYRGTDFAAAHPEIARTQGYAKTR